MESIIIIALTAIFRNRDNSGYTVNKAACPFPGVSLVTIGPLTEKYGVAKDIGTAIEYAKTLLFDRLENETELFDGEWLLKFAPGDYYENLEELTKEHQKHAYVKQHGINVELAMVDYRKAHRSVNHWLESVFDAHSFSLGSEKDIIFWRR